MASQVRTIDHPRVEVESGSLQWKQLRTTPNSKPEPVCLLHKLLFKELRSEQTPVYSKEITGGLAGKDMGLLGFTCTLEAASQ